MRWVSEAPPIGLEGVNVPTRHGPTPSWATANLARGKPSQAVFVLAHGYGGNRQSWIDVIPALRAKGFDSVAPSMPGQDESPVPRVGFGKLEAETILDAAEWCHEQGAKKVVVLGMSMGGAGAWLAAESRPKSIDGIITDSAFASFTESMNAFFDRKLPFGHVLLTPVVWFAKYRTGVDPANLLPVNGAQAWQGRPALIIQGSADTLVTRSHGERLAKASGGELWMVPEAEHVESFALDPPGYVKRLVTFANELP